jgi:hypothetical protein
MLIARVPKQPTKRMCAGVAEALGIVCVAAAPVQKSATPIVMNANVIRLDIVMFFLWCYAKVGFWRSLYIARNSPRMPSAMRW